MIIKENHIETIIRGLKAYLSPFKVDGQSIQLNIKGQSKEFSKGRYPQFYVETFRLRRDDSRRKSGEKYIYEVDIQNQLAKRKIQPVPFIVQFSLEFMEQNPTNYYKVKELIEMKFERVRFLELNYAGEIESAYMRVGNGIENELSDVLHVVWNIEVEIDLDVSNAVEDITGSLIINLTIKDGKICAEQGE